MDDAINNRMTLMNIMINQFILKNRIEPIDYTFDLFFDWYTNENGIIVIRKNLPMEEEFLLGITVRSAYSIAIFINETSIKVRSNFSGCHELNHCIFDINLSETSQQFFNVENNPDFYNEVDFKKEVLANAGAGVIMLPDITLLQYLHTMKSFSLIAEENKMSKAALWNRLVQFGIQRCGFPRNLAISAATRLQREGKREVYHKFLSTWGSTGEKQIIMDFENCL